MTPPLPTTREIVIVLAIRRHRASCRACTPAFETSPGFVSKGTWCPVAGALWQERISAPEAPVLPYVEAPYRSRQAAR